MSLNKHQTETLMCILQNVKLQDSKHIKQHKMQVIVVILVHSFCPFSFALVL